MRHRLLAAAAAALAMCSAAPALAQTYAYDEDGDVIVVYPYTLERERRGRFGEETYSMTGVVSARDLNLRYDGDVRVLYQRVNDTAHELCDEIGRQLRGAALTSDRDCVREAVRDAEPQIQDAVMRARW